ncbi:hypothetical protein BGZ81_010971 [Podila clonocystis]|nr:hypothetical protein BGZ81_010971 [Podila clonocystis]
MSSNQAMSFVPVKHETDLDFINANFHFSNAFPLPHEQPQHPSPQPYVSHSPLAPNHLYHTSDAFTALTIDTQVSSPHASSEDPLQDLDLFSHLNVELPAQELQDQLLSGFDPLSAPLNLSPNPFPGYDFKGSHGSSSSYAPSPSPSSSSLYSPALSSASSPITPYFDEGIIPVIACSSCKRSHVKCDHARPCRNCQKNPAKAATCRDADPKPRGRPKGGSKAAAEALKLTRQQQPHQARSECSTSTPPYGVYCPSAGVRRASYSSARSGWHPYVSAPCEPSSSRFGSRSLSSSVTNRQRRDSLSSPTKDAFTSLQHPVGIPMHDQMLIPFPTEGRHEAPMCRSLSDGSRVQRHDHHLQGYAVCPGRDNEAMAMLLRHQQEQQFELHLQYQSQHQLQQEEFRRQQEYVRKSLTQQPPLSES